MSADARQLNSSIPPIEIHNRLASLRAELNHLGVELLMEMSGPELQELMMTKYRQSYDLRTIRKERQRVIQAAGKRLPKHYATTKY